MENTTQRVVFFSAKEEQVQAFDRRSALCESLVSIWRVDVYQALRMCQDRKVEVDASEVTHVIRAVVF